VGHIAYVIDDELHRRAKALASRKGITFKAWVEQAIESEVDRQESEAEKRKR
jgi:predicted HicB family RNase H-like nuclease